MGPVTIENRVAKVERRLTRLEELPGRVDALASQILQLRTEMGGEFSAVRTQMQSLNERTYARMRMRREELAS